MPIADDVKLGKDVNIKHPQLVNLYGCEIGDNTRIGPFVEIQKNSKVGKLCKIQSHSFICEGVTIEDEVFIGHGVMFINDKYPRSAVGGKLKTDADWALTKVHVKKGASIGSAACIMCGVTIGEHAMVGAGALVTKDVPAYSIVTGVPSKVVGDIRKRKG